MTTLEIILISVLYIITARFIAKKWIKADNADIANSAIYLLSFISLPIVILVAIYRQTFYEDWR